MSHLKCFYYALLSYLAFPMIFNVAAVAQPQRDLQQIIQVWKARENRVRSARFTWTESLTLTPGAVLGKEPSSSPLQDDVTNRINATLLFDGDRIRYNTEGPIWARDQEKFAPRQYSSAFDGEESKAFYSDNPDNHIHPLGFVKNEKTTQDIQNYHLMPLLLSYRALHPAMNWLKPEQFKDREKIAFLRDRNCVIVESQAKSRKYIFSVDPQRDYSVLRFEEIVSDKLSLRIDVDYSNDREHGWVPLAWNVAMFNTVTSKVREGVIGKMKTYSINVPIEKQEFQIVFPPGTEVVDRKTNQSYLVLEDGKKRIITDEERLRNATYEQLKETDSGMAGLTQPNLWLRRVMWASLLACLVTLVLIWFRRRGHRRDRMQV